jgi:hypothetical protein
MGHCGPFPVLRCQFLDQRERTEARTVYALAQTIRVVVSTRAERQLGVFRAQWSVSGHPVVAAKTPMGTIVSATRFTFMAQADGWRMKRWVTITLFIVLGLLLLQLIAGFILR